MFTSNDSPLYFKEPTLDDKDIVQEFVDEFMERSIVMNGSSGMDSGVTYEQWLEKWKNDVEMKYEGYEKSEKVPSITLLCFIKNSNQLVGCVSFRKNNSRFLDENISGQIGWSIRPTLQRKGYGKQMALLCLEYCRSLGMDKVRIGCRVKNTGSRKIIQQIGGKLVKENNTMTKSALYEVVL